MMFAGLTSAYIVKSNQPKWLTFEMPRIFWYSTVVILLSSVTMQLALKEFKDRRINKYRNLITITLGLGILFIVMQCLGFSQLWNTGIHAIRRRCRALYVCYFWSPWFARCRGTYRFIDNIL